MKIENLCNFYASKYHLSIILLEYLKRKNMKKTKVVTFMQDNIEEEMNILNKKYKFNINLTKELNFKSAKDIYQKEVNVSKDMIFIVQGDLNYIGEANDYITEITEDVANVRVVNCYNFEEQKKAMKRIIERSDKILFTTGEKVID